MGCKKPTTTGSSSPAPGLPTPPNTRTNVYFDIFKTASVCESDRTEIERKCAPKTEAQRLFFRRSHTLALSFVAVLFLASLVALSFEFRTFDLEFALHVGGQLALVYLFVALIRSARAAHQAEP